VRARILAQRHYPPLARQRHQEGVVRVRFRLSAAGTLCQEVRVVRPSGFSLLDAQARQCVAAAAPFPPFPPELSRDYLTVEVPIVYRLTDGGI
jgi:protein TonB